MRQPRAQIGKALIAAGEAFTRGKPPVAEKPISTAREFKVMSPLYNIFRSYLQLKSMFHVQEIRLVLSFLHQSSSVLEIGVSCIRMIL